VRISVRSYEERSVRRSVRRDQCVYHVDDQKPVVDACLLGFRHLGHVSEGGGHGEDVVCVVVSGRVGIVRGR
jgi:hypothetical protein